MNLSIGNIYVSWIPSKNVAVWHTVVGLCNTTAGCWYNLNSILARSWLSLFFRDVAHTWRISVHMDKHCALKDEKKNKTTGYFKCISYSCMYITHCLWASKQSYLLITLSVKTKLFSQEVQQRPSVMDLASLQEEILSSKENLWGLVGLDWTTVF